MFDETNKIIEKIAKLLILGSQDFDDLMELIINVERPSSDSIGVQAEYYTYANETKYISTRKLLQNKLELFDKLYQVMTAQSDKHKWNRAKVTLNNDNKLDIKFEWDKELADELEGLSKEYDPRWDDTLSEEKNDKELKLREKLSLITEQYKKSKVDVYIPKHEENIKNFFSKNEELQKKGLEGIKQLLNIRLWDEIFGLSNMNPKYSDYYKNIFVDEFNNFDEWYAFLETIIDDTKNYYSL